MEELIRKAKNGDKEAFTEAILLIQNDLFNYAYNRIKNVYDTDDVIQETMLHAFKNINKLREDKYFKTWIFAILINECNQYFKKRKRNHDKILKEINNNIDWTIDDIENRVDIELMYDSIINKLKPIEQTIVILYYGNNYTRKEISEILNIKEETIKTKLRRIKNKIEKIKNSRKGDK